MFPRISRARSRIGPGYLATVSKYRGFRGSLFSIHPLSGCERLPRNIARVFQRLVINPASSRPDRAASSAQRVDIAPTIRCEKDRLSLVRAFESPEAGRQLSLG